MMTIFYDSLSVVCLAAGLGVAYRAHAAVRRAAPVVIEHGDLRALLYLQGIAKRDFVLG